MFLYGYYFRMGACLYIIGNWSLEDSFLFPSSFLAIILLEILHCALVPSHSNALVAKHIQYFILWKNIRVELDRSLFHFQDYTSTCTHTIRGFFPHTYLAGFLLCSWINTYIKWRYTLLQTNTIIFKPPQDPLSNGGGRSRCSVLRPTSLRRLAADLSAAARGRPRCRGWRPTSRPRLEADLTVAAGGRLAARLEADLAARLEADLGAAARGRPLCRGLRPTSLRRLEADLAAAA
jgi:hypothetical protein